MPANSIFFAHSTDRVDRRDWQRLDEHLHAVAELAALRAERFNCASYAKALGLAHDLGKYSDEFQQRLAGAKRRVDHSTAGALTLLERYGEPLGTLLAYAVAGHHAGLANGIEPGARSPLKYRLAADLPTLSPRWKDEVALPEIEPPPLKPEKERACFQYAFFCRMLFSCLVDADFVETEAFYAEREGAPKTRGQRPNLAALQSKLNQYLDTFNRAGDVNERRHAILKHVREQASSSPGHFSLTVPTGGGKTVTSLAFALDHAIKHGLDRIIYVIPFTSIVEQNAAVFRKAFDDLGAEAVLEQHSSFDTDTVPAFADANGQTKAKLKRDSENWDAPVIVTTAVQFFESLFAAKTSRCRKLHNIANSVVILDEAQTLPLPLLRPSLAALDELRLNYGTSVVYCTATQPALTDDHGGELPEALKDVRELAPDPHGLFGALKRVTVRHCGTQSDAEITAQLCDNEQVLCIVNNRRHARALFDSVADKSGARHLTTAMYAVHRRKVLADIRQRLEYGQPCRVIATSLIEAGVDVDFPLVLRAEAGLDAIAQAAGRCNREGRRNAADSEVRIFATDNEDWAPPPELRRFAQVMGEILRNHPDDDPLTPRMMERYFSALYWQQGQNDLDRHCLLSTLKNRRIDDLPFEWLEEKYRLIENTQRPIIIPVGDAESALRVLEHAEVIGGIARRLQPYTVQVPRKGFDALWRVGAIAPVREQDFGGQFVKLINMSLYNKYSGLTWTDPTFMSAESLIV